MGLEIVEKMVVYCKMMMKNVWRGLSLAVLAFFILSSETYAAPPAPSLGETDWRTGEIDICWSGVTPGNTIILYTKRWDQPSFVAHSSWVAETVIGCRVVGDFQNSQSIWHYIVQVDEAGEESEPSTIEKQTPPITAYIVNWPSMLEDLLAAMREMNESLKAHLDKLMTPSESSMEGLLDAVNNLKNALGVGSVDRAGNQMVNELDDVIRGLKPPVVEDDGDGTFTGGKTGGELPFNKTPHGDLIGPDPDSGTDTELTIRIPYTVDMQGNLLYMKLFTEEQLEKMKWLGLMRTLAVAVIYIFFGIWLVSRFAPQLKS